jgi:hypothetical protein
VYRYVSGVPSEFEPRETRGESKSFTFALIDNFDMSERPICRGECAAGLALASAIKMTLDETFKCVHSRIKPRESERPYVQAGGTGPMYMGIGEDADVLSMRRVWALRAGIEPCRRLLHFEVGLHPTRRSRYVVNRLPQVSRNAADTTTAEASAYASLTVADSAQRRVTEDKR